MTPVTTPLLLWLKSTQKHVPHILGCGSEWKSALWIVLFCSLLSLPKEEPVGFPVALGNL